MVRGGFQAGIVGEDILFKIRSAGRPPGSRARTGFLFSSDIHSNHRHPSRIHHNQCVIGKRGPGDAWGGEDQLPGIRHVGSYLRLNISTANWASDKQNGHQNNQAS